MAPVLALLVALAPPARAAWGPGGVPLSPSATSIQGYSQRVLVADAAGGAFAVWELQQLDPYEYYNQYSLHAQRVDLLGNRPAPWQANGASMLSWIDGGSSGTYAVAPIGLYADGSGGAVLALLDFTFIVEYMRLFRLHHIAAGGSVAPITISNATFGGYPVQFAAADGDGAGGVVMIALQQTFALPPEPPPPGGLYAQRVSAEGNALWTESLGLPGVELTTLGQGAAGGVAALSDGAGGGFFAWIDGREAGDPDLYVQHIGGDGNLAAGWPPGGVQVCGAAGSQHDPRLAPDGAGGIIVGWVDERGSGPRLYARRILAAGTASPGVPADGRELPSSDTGDALVALASDAQGGCFVLRATSGITHLYCIDAAMETRAGWPAAGLALNALATTTVAALMPDGLGGAYLCFRNGSGSASPQGLYAQHVSPDGVPAPGWPAGGFLLSATGFDGKVVPSGDGAIVSWNDARSSYRGIYGQRIVTDGLVAAGLALVSASATADGVSLRWLSASGMRSAAVERSADGSGWTFLAGIDASGTGLFEYVDHDVTKGARYGYRLTWREGAALRTGGEVWVVVPRELSLSLAAPAPNPSAGAVTLAATLPEASGARLDVFDVSGRRVAGRDLTSLGAGSHVVPLHEAPSLAPGIYVVKLTQAGATRRVRLVRIE